MTTTPAGIIVLGAFVLGVIGGMVLQPFVTPAVHRRVTFYSTPAGCDWVYADEKHDPGEQHPTPLGGGRGRTACSSNLNVNSTTEIYCECSGGGPP